MLYVTHDPEELAAIADETLVLERGRVVAVGPTAEVTRNDNPVASPAVLAAAEEEPPVETPDQPAAEPAAEPPAADAAPFLMDDEDGDDDDEVFP
jgi:ABC-type glutathione transport system ATPase component